MTEIAAGFVDITPSRPERLAGFAGSGAPTSRIRDALEANAVLLRSGDGHVVLLAVDCLFCGDLEERVLRRLNIPGLAVHAMASHSHYAPGIQAELDDRISAYSREHTAMVEERVCSLIVRLISQLEADAQAGLSRSAHQHATNRRRRGFRLLRTPPFIEFGIQNAPNPSGSTVDTVSAVHLAAGSRPVAIVWTAHAHPTAAPWRSAVSAAYPGAVRSQLRAAAGDPSLAVLFALGGAANARASCTTTSSRSKRMLALTKQSLGLGSSWKCPTEGEWSSWASQLGDAVPATAELQPIKHVQVARESCALSVVDAHSATPRRLECSLLRLDPVASVVGLNIELMAEHVSVVEAEFEGGAVAHGYLGQAACYYPTTEMTKAGGYEVDRSLSYFGASGRHTLDNDRRLVQLVQATRVASEQVR